MTLDPLGTAEVGGGVAQVLDRQVKTAPTRRATVAGADFGQFLWDLLRARGLHPHRFARSLGVSPATLTLLRQGKRTASGRMALRIADALDLQGRERVEFFARWDLARLPESLRSTVLDLIVGRITPADLPPGIVADARRALGMPPLEPEAPPVDPAAPPDDD